MRLILKFVLILCFFIDIAHAQTPEPNYLTSDGRQLVSTVGKTKPADIVGSPYYNDTFELAKISIDSGKIYGMRYNAFTQDMEVKTNNDKILYLDKSLVGITVNFVNSNEIYKNFKIKNGTEEQTDPYLFLLLVSQSTSEFLLLEAPKKKFVEGKIARTGYEKDTSPEYKDQKSDFYIGVSATEAVAVPNKSKELMSLFPEHSNDLKTFLKKNKINTSKKEDLLVFVNYLNTLKS